MSRWIPPHLVHRIVQYSQPPRPGMTRITASRAPHCGQSDSTVAEDIVAEDEGDASVSNRSMDAVLCDPVKPPIIPSAAALMLRIA
jgi:hypothetical protein